MYSRSCEDDCPGYKQIGIDACQGCAGRNTKSKGGNSK